MRILVAAAATAAVIAILPHLPSASAANAPTFTQTNLVSDVPGMAARTDPNLVNPWGMTVGLNGGIWVSDNGSGKATSYDGKGQPVAPQTITIPAPGKAGGKSAPTGAATNATTGFVISAAGKSGPSTQLFSTEDGTIAGWNNSVDPANAVIAVDRSSMGAVYKGLALGFDAGGALLFAANFAAGSVDVFDSRFEPVRTRGRFVDPQLPNGYAPFGIACINARVYVTYAQQDPEKKDDVPGAGHGYIDIFDMEGNLVRRFASQGQLNSPWGMAWAPFEGFGKFDNALLVGNFGDGSINAFDFDSGEFLGALTDSTGKAIKIPGVWGLQFGLAVAATSPSTLFFTAGIANEAHGLFGSLTVDAASLPAPEGPTMTDPNLRVTTVIGKLNQPIGMAFLGPADFLVLEKASGKVQHVVNGAVVGTALDLAVNSASERGLLGIALQPDFAQSHGVYLYWTQSSTGADSANLPDVPTLGNRVDRYLWNPASETLTFDKNIIMLRSFQDDTPQACCGSVSGQPLRGNHDGGKILFGHDGKLYFQIGDQGRRGQMQNLARGPFGTGMADDEFGGPAPDDAHLTGVIFRLNPDGTSPADNPFAGVSANDMAEIEQRAGVTLTAAQLNAVAANIHKIYSYGRRNGFGLAFDPATGFLWESENGDDAFDEMNRITPGSNGGWIQIMGPLRRFREYKRIETSLTAMQGNLPVAGNVALSAIDPATFNPALQQIRWPPTLLARSPGQALLRLFVLPGSHFEGPEFSWRWAVAPAAIGFAGAALGPKHQGKLFVGASRTFLDEGYLFEFPLDSSRQHFAFTDPGLKDGVDDNDYKFDEGQSASLVAGKNFGIVTDIMSGPDGNLYVVSLSNGAIYMIR
jgi:aldose sugar dehydrogenase